MFNNSSKQTNDRSKSSSSYRFAVLMAGLIIIFSSAFALVQPSKAMFIAGEKASSNLSQPKPDSNKTDIDKNLITIAPKAKADNS